MTVPEVLEFLQSKGNDQTKKILSRHGATEPFYGVKVGDMKPLQKKIKKDHELSLALYETGVGDAMYLAGLIADEDQISKEDLQRWIEGANWYMLSEYAVAWITSESRFGWELGLEWIESDDESIASAGWATLTNVISITQDEEINIAKVKDLMIRATAQVHEGENRVSYTMNGFVLGAGAYISELTDYAMGLGEQIGKVKVNMGETSCKVPHIPSYLKKMMDKNYIGKKRKGARC